MTFESIKLIDGIELYAEFVIVPNTLERHLWKVLPWVKHEDRPRHEVWFNDFNMPYTYGSGKGIKTYQPSTWDESILNIRENIKDDFGIQMDSCFVNGYKDGHDHLGWHSDNSPEMDDTRPIIVISLGAEREIWVRKLPVVHDIHYKFHKYKLPSGSAFIMPPGMQDTHQHRIPKSADYNCPSRISLTFRGLVKL